jgi:CDP-diacylglycerol--serine O-phosphatidyltransferase
MKREKIFKSEHRKGIYILPNIFTSLNIFCGFYGIVAAFNGKFVAAAVSIVIAGIFDGLDGKIARATNSTSEFGLEYDSLADVISFGLAPALIMYLWALKPLGRMGWLAAFLFTVCGALRLARFNTQSGTVSSDHFVGLPIPAGAGMNAVIILLCSKLNISNVNPYVILLTVYSLSFLMVSSIRYNSFKKPELFKKMKFNVLVSVILVLILVAAQTSIALFIMGASYVLSGPAAAVFRYFKGKKEKDEKTEIQEHEEEIQREHVS